MKTRWHGFLRAASAAVFLAGIAVPVLSIAGSDKGDASGEAVRREVREAARAIRDFSAEQKDEAVKTGKKVLKDMDARIERMEGQLREAWSELDQDARKRWKETLSHLRERRNELSEWFGAMKHGSRDAWDRMKEGFSRSYEEMEEAFENAGESSPSSGARGKTE